ncbi:hypothetical protein [Tenacibaculum sp. 190524A05c]|uniref:hypothetical protein n=1 Tax=Tenacibaculum platacis TaxID=3137852 RepID=UPI0032B2CD26
MKNRILITLISLVFLGCKGEKKEQIIFTEDVENYWNAFDKIITTKDSVLQLKYLKEEFIDKASIGQQTMFQVRNYSPEEYIHNINTYPKFWKSVRENTIKCKSYKGKISDALRKLKSIYHTPKPAKVYYTMGGFRTNGTVIDSLVLYGSEMLFLDENINTSEFKTNHVKNYASTNPIDDIEFTAVHEFVHTQQESFIGSNLLSACVYEGVAEFTAKVSTGIESPNACISYGMNNEEIIKDRFQNEMFGKEYSFWLWNSMENMFDNQRDLGYFVGYAIAKKFYENYEGGKKDAIKELIELQYSNDNEIIKFVDRVKFFDKPMKELQKAYEENRPRIINISSFENLSTSVKPGKHLVKLEFSEEMDTRFRGFDYGPLGENHVLYITKFIGFSEDSKSVSFEVDLKPNKRYQMEVKRFRSKRGGEFLPFLIDITTK